MIKDEAMKRLRLFDEVSDFAIKNRWMFIEHEAAVRIGLLDAAAITLS